MIKLKNILKEWSEVDPGPKRWFKPYGDKYTAYEKATNKSLKEYSVDDSGKETLKSQLDIIEKGLRQITSAPVSVSDRNGVEFRAKWSYVKREIPTSIWNRVLEFIEEEHGIVDMKKSSNYYETNWEPEEPAEAVPTLYFTLR
tara:strand:+ start:1308 stop:1736 length:429 start_codon:yes stop_codon:yes gene_type:complete